MDNFDKLKVLGVGSYGDVWLVERRTDQQKFALKKVPIYDEDLALMFLQNNQASQSANPLNEVKLLEQLDHPNIIRLLDSFIYKKKLCIVMQYASEGDLSKRIKQLKQSKQYFEEDQVMLYFAQICLAIDYLYDNKILHRDIKIQNIMIFKSGILKLGDFGISKKLDNHEQLAQTSLGTPYYLSPEICQSKSYNHSTDIWMLGCVLCEIAGFQKPFQGASIPEVIGSILKEDPKALPIQYSATLQSIYYWLLSKVPEERPSIKQLINLEIIQAQFQKLKDLFPEDYKDYNFPEKPISFTSIPPIFSEKVAKFSDDPFNVSVQQKQAGHVNQKHQRKQSVQYMQDITVNSQDPINDKDSKKSQCFTPQNDKKLNIQFQQSNNVANSNQKKEQFAQNSILNIIQKAKQNNQNSANLTSPINKNTNIQDSAQLSSTQHNFSAKQKEAELNEQQKNNTFEDGNINNKDLIMEKQIRIKMQKSGSIKSQKLSFQKQISISTDSNEGGAGDDGNQLSFLNSKINKLSYDLHDSSSKTEGPSQHQMNDQRGQLSNYFSQVEDPDTDKQKMKQFLVGNAIFNTNNPISPNRKFFLQDFLKNKIGEVKYKQVQFLLENSLDTQGPSSKCLKQIQLILGEENAEYLQIIKFLGSNNKKQNPQTSNIQKNQIKSSRTSKISTFSNNNNNNNDTPDI